MAKLPPIPHSIPIYPIISSKHGWFCTDLLLITPSIPKGLGKSSQSIDWFQGTFFGKPHISHRKKTWNFQWKKTHGISSGFPFNQSMVPSCAGRTTTWITVASPRTSGPWSWCPTATCLWAEVGWVERAEQMDGIEIVIYGKLWNNYEKLERFI